MTNNTIPNVPFELLETLIEQHITAHGFTNHTARQAQLILCATSPAGGGGLGNTANMLLPALRQYMHNDGSGLLAGYDLETTKAIIDGLRGENERIRLNIAEYNEAIACYQSERDQQAKRIGELEGLLRACHSALYPFDNKVLESEIDAALSAGKDGE